MSEAPDQTVELLQRWHGGDRSALESLLSRHIEALHNHVRAKLDCQFASLRRDQDSLDLVQAAAVRVLQYTPPFIPRDGGQFQALLRKIVLNELRNQVRSPRQIRREPGSDPFGDSVVDLRLAASSALLPERQAEDAEQQGEARAWARMGLEFLADDQDRQLVLLAAVEEWSWEEIGQEFGLSADAARMRYHRLLPRLANRIRLLKEGRVGDLLGEDSA